jgi:hypothetical protein
MVKIRINPSKSPFNLLKDKLKKNKIKRKHDERTKNIEKINEQIKTMNDLFDEEENVSIKYDPTPLQNRLLKMIYLDDIDSEFVKNEMGISDDVLENLVNQLVKVGLIEYKSDNEVELTNEGIYYIVNRDLILF